MATSPKKKLFLFIFCLASITEGMYSTYFVSILTTIERVYQIQSKTAGAMLSATEIGQILGSLFIAYYGGRGNKLKWISLCMAFSALAALISITPHFLLNTKSINGVGSIETGAGNVNLISNPAFNLRQSASLADGNESFIPVTPSPYLSRDLGLRPLKNSSLSSSSSLSSTLPAPPKIELPSHDLYCHRENIERPLVASADNKSPSDDVPKPLPIDAVHQQPYPVGIIIIVFFTCLLAIGFGSTAITTLGIPFMDDIISKEESPLYLGMTIGLRIFGPALGFLIGSFCIQLDLSTVLPAHSTDRSGVKSFHGTTVGAWWLGLILISVPLLILAIPMYCLSKTFTANDSEKDDYEDITYQAAEDHDIGGSQGSPAHILRLGGDLDLTSSSSDASLARDILQGCSNQFDSYNYKRNIVFVDRPIFSHNPLAIGKSELGFANNCDAGNQRRIGEFSDTNNTDWPSQNVCLVVNHFGGLESTNFTDDGEQSFKSSQQNSSCPQHSSSSRSSVASTIPQYPIKDNCRKQPTPPLQQHDVLAISNLSSSLSRLIKNRLLLLRMLSAVLHILPIAGFFTFLPKYLIEQFRITSSSASAISGLAGILFVGFGAFIGGTIIRAFNVNSRLMTRWIALSALLYTIGMLALMNLSCGHNQTIHYDSSNFLSTDCSTMCHCSRAIYNPVCANGTTYLSPCLAGCKAHTIAEDRLIFDECGCSPRAIANAHKFNGTLSSGHPHVNLNVATQGACVLNCDNLIWYVTLFSIFTLIHSSSEVGSMMFNLRCVKSGDRTLALGLITFTSSLFGKFETDPFKGYHRSFGLSLTQYILFNLKQVQYHAQ